MAENHVLIIGQGLAGTVLSYRLTQRSIRHKVIDNNHKSAATLAAAGIVNPITGRRYVKSWMIDELLPSARRMYHAFEKLLGASLISEHNILRSFETIAEENRWTDSTSRPGYKEYIVDPAEIGHYAQLLRQQKSYGEITQSLKVDVALMIKYYRQYLIDNNRLINARFDFQSVNEAGSCKLEGETYTKLVDCTGYASAINGPFSYLPFQPAKGESFIVSIDAALPDKLLRDSFFIAPIDENSFWTGGGYEWNAKNNNPTSRFRTLWQERLEQLLSVPFKIESHLAGIRPSVKGRRPLLGQHPTIKNLYLFNGFGTKGTSLAPYWSQKMADLLEHSQPISSESNVSRFQI